MLYLTLYVVAGVLSLAGLLFTFWYGGKDITLEDIGTALVLSIFWPLVIIVVLMMVVSEFWENHMSGAITKMMCRPLIPGRKKKKQELKQAEKEGKAMRTLKESQGS